MKQIENIFSKTKPLPLPSCPNPKTPIILDKRENNSLIKANLIEQKASFSEEILEIGDYLIKDTIIERKTYSDFLSSITDKRLFNQIKEMKKYPNQILILESFDFSYKSRLHENAIRGTILSLAKHLPIIYTENPEDTAKFLIAIARKKEKTTPSNTSLRETKSSLTLEQQKQFILEGFPGIGPTSAKKLLNKFGSLKKIFNSKKEELDEILEKTTSKKFNHLLEA
jgi:ERCC4-type nuclease